MEPRQKNKIRDILPLQFTTLSLNLKKDKSQEKTFIFMFIIYSWHFEHIYV